EGVQIIQARGQLAGPHTIEAAGTTVHADVLLIATGGSPRVLPEAVPDGERILTCLQIYILPDLPKVLIVVCSSVTGAEFAGADQALGPGASVATSRERVLPHEDKDAAVLIEGMFGGRGMAVLGRSGAEAVNRKGVSVVVPLADGRTLTGSHGLLTVG